MGLVPSGVIVPKNVAIVRKTCVVPSDKVIAW